MFAKWNVEGLLGGFSPSEAYRKTHVQDVRDSPALLSQLENKTMPVRDMNGIPLVGLELGHVNSSVLPKVHLPYFPVASHNSIAQSLSKMRAIRKAIG
jgi:hypothetical protein